MIAGAHAEHPMLGAVLYLMCDDLSSVIGLPSRGEIGLYEPTHPTMIQAHSP